jgi:hypothetical protein
MIYGTALYLDSRHLWECCTLMIERTKSYDRGNFRQLESEKHTSSQNWWGKSRQSCGFYLAFVVGQT